MNRVYGFTGEVAAKFTGKTFPLFTEVFCALPLAHCIGGKVLVVHGGLFSKDGVSASAFDQCPHMLSRPRPPFAAGGIPRR